jgi:predicted nucleotidyltransferase
VSDRAIGVLKSHAEKLRRDYGVKSLALFGSVARGDATPESDIDILVEFSDSPGFDGYMALKFFLEDLLGRKVDLVMASALKPWARPTVEAEAIRVT